MKKSIVVLMVCLMVTSAFATNTWTGGTGTWSTLSGWTNGSPTGAEQVKIGPTAGAVLTLDVTTPTFVAGKLTLNNTGQLIIGSSGTLNLGTEFQIGDSTAGASVVQTGGTVNAVTGTSTAKIEIGYKLNGSGTYTISGGTIAGNATSQMIIGGAGSPGAKGTFTVQGSDASITIGKLFVGTKDSSGGFAGTGALDFEVGASGVSPITVTAITDGVVLDNAGASSVANLIVNLTAAPPSGDILLVKNNSGLAVNGLFDALNGGSAIEGATVVLSFGGSDTPYTLTYVYNAAGSDGVANDIALVPEPATIALLSIGLLAIRRNRK